MLNFNFKNHSKQGLVGLGKAMSYYLTSGYIVSIPITDNQGYDLIVDDGQQLYKIQVKTTRYKVSKHFVVQLRTISGRKILGFNPKNFDQIFILTQNNETYLIPSDVLKKYKCTITLTKIWDKYKIEVL